MNKLLQKFGSQVQLNYPLAELTTVDLGGPAQYYLPITAQEDLIEALKLTREEKIPYLLMGGGSNLLISDEGFPGLVIHNQIERIIPLNKMLVVSSGTKLQNLIDFTIEHSLAGIHKLTGIPGTVGGAIYGNAGAYGQTVSDCLVKILALNPQSGEITALDKNRCDFRYRESAFKKNKLIVLESYFQFSASEENALQSFRQEAEEIYKQRINKYPHNLKCPGSFFKNVLVENIPQECLKIIPNEKIIFNKIPAGYLLEEVGGKGQKVGQIEISPNHANLFINLGGGKAGDFYQLAKTMADKVKAKFNITLEPEVQLINLPPL